MYRRKGMAVAIPFFYERVPDVGNMLSEKILIQPIGVICR